MGRDRKNKPRKEWGSGGLSADTLVLLDTFPGLRSIGAMNGARLSEILLGVCLDPAVMALRRVHTGSGREAYYGAAREKGLERGQSELLEGLFVLLNRIRDDAEKTAETV